MRSTIASLTLTALTIASISTHASALSLIPQAKDLKDFKAPQSSYQPTIVQIGNAKANVPMKHGSCGLDCGQHVLANKSGNLDMKFSVKMSCPPGQKVAHLSFQPKAQQLTVLIDKPTNAISYSQNVVIQPFSLEELEDAGNKALGGTWAQPNSHNNKTKTVQTTLTDSIDVWGQCSGQNTQQKQTIVVTLPKTRCVL
uniref:Lipoprotein n=1 Tax=Tolypothrix bouteillei VB521301 TaxID=1479485 RepID=A0A0C1QZN3_9CYAN